MSTYGSSLAPLPTDLYGDILTTAAEVVDQPRSRIVIMPKSFHVANEMYPRSMIVLFSIGEIGNILSFLILSRKSQRKSNTSIYLRALAVADFMTIWAYFMHMFSGIYNHSLNSRIYCKLIIYCQSAFQMTSSYLIIAVSLERFFAVMFPLSVGRIFTKKTAIVLSVSIFVAFLLFNIPYLYFCEPTYMNRGCSFDRSSELYLKWKNFDSAISSYLPTTIILILNIMIILQVKRAQKIQKEMQNNQDSKLQDQSGQITRMLIALTLSYWILTFPMGVYFAGGDEFFDMMTKQGYSDAYLMQTVAIFLLLCNNSINFYLYVLTGKRFRDEFLMMLGCKKPEVNKTTRMTTRSVVTGTTVSEKIPMENQA